MGGPLLNIVPRAGLAEMGLPGKTCMEVGGWPLGYLGSIPFRLREEPL